MYKQDSPIRPYAGLGGTTYKPNSAAGFFCAMLGFLRLDYSSFLFQLVTWEIEVLVRMKDKLHLLKQMNIAFIENKVTGFANCQEVEV